MTPDITALVERLRGVTEEDAYARPWTFGETCRRAADALSAQAAELVEARAENSKLRERIASEQAWTAAARMRTDEATRSRDEALAALKVAEERVERLREALMISADALDGLGGVSDDHVSPEVWRIHGCEYAVSNAWSVLENSKARLADATQNPGMEQREAGRD